MNLGTTQIVQDGLTLRSLITSAKTPFPHQVPFTASRWTYHLREWRWEEGTVETTVCCAQSLQSCPTLCNPTDCSLPGSSVYGVILARILEWVAILSSRGSSRPRDQTHIPCVSCIGRQVLLPLRHCRGKHRCGEERRMHTRNAMIRAGMQDFISLSSRES